MFGDLLSAIWRRVPRRLRSWTVRLSNASFAVTAGAIVTDGRGRVLLLKHRFRPGSGWGMPGGFLEEGEQPSDAVRRELREEIGLEVEDLELVFTRAFKVPQQVEIIFRCRAVGNPEQLNFEIQKAAWFSPGEFPPELSRDQRELINRLLNHGGTRPD